MLIAQLNILKYKEETLCWKILDCILLYLNYAT